MSATVEVMVTVNDHEYNVRREIPTSPEVNDLDAVKKDLDVVVGQIKAAMAADQWDTE